MIRAILVTVALLCPGRGSAATCTAETVAGAPTQTWDDQVTAALLGEDACFPDRSAFTNSDCNIFAGRVTETLYGFTDFVRPKAAKGSRYLTANEIAIALLSDKSSHWELLGMMSDQAALDLAQKRASDGAPVIAVWHNPKPDSPGHIALVGPGPLTASATLKLRTPVSASFFQADAAANYIGKPLACAFRKEQVREVRIYSRVST